jgi:glutamate-5-semialdehyde dehydrogenase
MAEISEVVSKAKAAHQAARKMALASTDLKNKALLMIADMLEEKHDDILKANELDLAAARQKGMAPAMVERLTLTEQRISDMATGVRQVVSLTDPVGRIIDEWTRPNGLAIQKITVPLGVIAMIFESRPNVTVDAAVLCIKSGNSCVLRGGSEAIHSNTALARVIRMALEKAGLCADAVTLIENTDRALVKELLEQRRYIDVAIPRGGAGLIKMVVDTAVVPVIETGSGVCHVYVDKDADLDMAVRIIENAKVSRPSTCNAMETLLVHQAVLEPLMAKLLPVMKERQVELRGDDRTCTCSEQVKQAGDDDWATEYNALIMSIRAVASMAEAIDHISTYGTKHSETIVTENKERAERFMAEVDAAVVYVNASTRFTDGFEFGFGAEIGISTQKLHVRGPMGLEALVSYKYKIHGQGQVR